jgi:hypothetical protein
MSISRSKVAIRIDIVSIDQQIKVDLLDTHMLTGSAIVTRTSLRTLSTSARMSRAKIVVCRDMGEKAMGLLTASDHEVRSATCQSSSIRLADYDPC